MTPRCRVEARLTGNSFQKSANVFGILVKAHAVCRQNVEKPQEGVDVSGTGLASGSQFSTLSGMMNNSESSATCDNCSYAYDDANGNTILVAPGATWSADGCSGCTVEAANNGNNFSWWGAFGKSLFSWKNFSAGFKPGGCFAQFAEEAFDPAADIAGQDAAIKATAQSGAYVAATAYAAQQGLVVPMRSSIVRGILDIGEVGGEAIALIPTIYAEGQALNNEVKSFANGECQ